MTSRTNHCATRAIHRSDDGLSRVVSHLRRAIAEYMEHYYEERNRQRLENMLIMPSSRTKSDGKVAVGSVLAAS